MFRGVKMITIFLVVFIRKQQDLHYLLPHLIKRDIYHSCGVEWSKDYTSSKAYCANHFSNLGGEVVKPLRS